MRSYYDPNEFYADSDSVRIQMAIAAAKESGCNKVVIPSFNERTGEHLWVIDKTIELPSHIYLLIDNAHLRMQDGVICQMFRNENAFTELGTTPEGLQEDIIIQGQGRALLDGGLHNGIRERNPNRDNLPRVFHNLTIFLHNVRNFKLDGLTFRDQRYWAVCFVYAWDGVVSNLRFEIGLRSHRTSLTSPWKNQDGIDLRIGCHDIQIFNLTGETCDDIVALTALGNEKTPNRMEMLWRCRHLNEDIYNVTIHNITGFNNHCSMVRLLCHFGHQIYNVDIAHLQDATPDGQSYEVEESIRVASCVKIGENGYYPEPEFRCKPGDLHDITVTDLNSSALAAVALNASAKNVTIRNLHVGKMGRHAVALSRVYAGVHRDPDDPENVTAAENVLIDGLHYGSAHPDTTPFYFRGACLKNFRVCHAYIPAQFRLTDEARTDEKSEKILWDDLVRE